jgi:glycosyltransferase involved in cell wall biosynthesis
MLARPYADPSTMAKITACVVAKDEEEKIGACLESLAGVADEMVVLDSGSTDRTLEIARAHGATVAHQDWLGMAEQKNAAVALASHDWILNLDCDERLSPALAASIKAEKERLGRAPAYWLERRTRYVYRYLDHAWYPERRVRLYDRTRCKHEGHGPHDHVVVTGGEAQELAGDILHDSFDSISDHLRTIDAYTELAARELVAQGRRVGPLTPFLRGAWTGFRVYVLKRGFLDGFAGASAAFLSGVHVFAKYAKVRMANLKGDA